MNSREQSRTLARDAMGGRSDRRLSPRVEQAAFGLPNQLVARVSAGVFFVCGSLSLVALALPPSRGGNATGVALVGLAAILIAIVCWHLPWDAWPRWTTHVLVPTGLLLIALGVTFSTVDPGALGVFYCAVFAIIGIAHPPGTALRMLPLLAVMYVLPQLTRTQDVPTTAASLLIVAVICIGVAELLARIMVKLQRSQLALQQAHDAISAVSADLTALDPRLLARSAQISRRWIPGCSREPRLSGFPGCSTCPTSASTA